MTNQQYNEFWLTFHDIIIHDNTAKINHYKMTLSLFVSIDNNFKQEVKNSYSSSNKI